MTKYNSSNVNLSNSEFTKLKSELKYLLSNMTGVYNDEIIFKHKLLPIDMEVLRLFKAFSNNSYANTKLSKTQLNIMVQLSIFIGITFISTWISEINDRNSKNI